MAVRVLAFLAVLGLNSSNPSHILDSWAISVLNESYDLSSSHSETPKRSLLLPRSPVVVLAKWRRVESSTLVVERVRGSGQGRQAGIIIVGAGISSYEHKKIL